MMACIFGKSGRITTSGSKFGEKRNIRWDLIGKCVEKNEKKFYTQARARLINEQATRTFQIGETVMLKFGDGSGDEDDDVENESEEDEDDDEDEEDDSSICLAQILQFYETLRQDGTVEGKNADTYFIEIKWLYRPQDVKMKEIRKAGLKSPLKYEHYFSDHVDRAPIESIIGLAHLRQTKKGLDSFYKKPPKSYWEGTDKAYLCRYFYASSDPEGHLKRMRKLESSELAFLLQNPTRKDLFERGQLFRRNGPVLKVDENNQPLMYKHKPILEDQTERIKKKKKDAQHRKMYKCKCCATPAASPATQDAEPEADMEVVTEQSRKRDRVAANSTDDTPHPNLTVSGAAAVDLQVNSQDAPEIEPARTSESTPAPKRRRVAVVEDQGFAPNASGLARLDAKVQPVPSVQDANVIKDEEELEELFDIPPPDDPQHTFASTLNNYGLNQRLG